MTPADIAAAIREEGRDVTVQRLVSNAVTASLACRAMVRGYKPAELAGGIIQGDTRIVVAALTLAEGGFPVPFRKGDRVVIDGRTTTIQAADPIHAGQALGKWIIQARG